MALNALVLHELPIGAFMIVTTPVTCMLLVRAAVHRDPIEGQAPGTRTGAAQDARDAS